MAHSPYHFLERPTHWSEILGELHMDDWCRFTDGGFVKNYTNFEVTDPSIKKPTEDELNKKLTEVQTEWDAQEYVINRRNEYWALNQFELISDDAINGTTTHKDAIVAIKTKWPKDNTGPVE